MNIDDGKITIAMALHALNKQSLLKLKSVILYYHMCNPSIERPNP